MPQKGCDMENEFNEICTKHISGQIAQLKYNQITILFKMIFEYSV